MKTPNLILLILAITFACSEKKTGSQDSSEQLTGQDKTKMQLYYKQGKKLYATYCTSCHQTNGKGLASLYPPLSGADYLMKDPAKMACIIKKGLSGEIVVNGTTYNQPMPALEHLSNLEIAEIITYISNSWENESTLHDVKAIEAVTKECL